MADEEKDKVSDLDYLKYLEEKEKWTDEEKFLFEALSMQNRQLLPDLDYLEYLRTGGHWNKEQKLHWAYLSAIVKLLLHLTGESPDQEKNPDLTGRYRIYTPPKGGIKKGPPPVII